jgi:hypothetical protein
MGLSDFAKVKDRLVGNPVPASPPLSPFRLSLLGRFPRIASTFYWISAACITEARVEVRQQFVEDRLMSARAYD